MLTVFVNVTMLSPFLAWVSADEVTVTAASVSTAVGAAAPENQRSPRQDKIM